MGEVTDVGHQPSRAGCIGKAEARSAHGFDRGLEPLDLVEQFFAALGLGGAGGAGPETVDVGLLGAQFFLLPFEGGLGGFPLERFLLEVLAVVAEVAAGDAALGFHDLVADAIEEGAVMADHHQGGGLLHQVALEPLDRFHVEVVGGLVQQQQIRLLQQDFPEGNAHLPATGVVAHQLLGPLGGEADRGQQFVDAGLEFVAVQRLKAAMQATQFVDQLVEMVGVGCSLLAAHGLFHLPLAVEHLGGFAKGLKQLLAHRAAGVDVEFLLEVGNAGLALAHHLAAAGLFHARNDFHLGGFAGAVDPHQANAIARLHLPGDIPQHLAGGINLANTFKTEHGA